MSDVDIERHYCTTDRRVLTRVSDMTGLGRAGRWNDRHDYLVQWTGNDEIAMSGDEGIAMSWRWEDWHDYYDDSRGN
jgi:hypothetical protein